MMNDLIELLGYIVLVLLVTNLKSFIVRKTKSKIISADNFIHVEKILEQIGLNDNEKVENVLVILDVDETMITMKDKFLRPSAYIYNEDMYDKIFFPLTDPDKCLKYSHFITQAETDVVHERVPTVIKNLQNRQIKVLGLTSMIPGAGKCGIIKSMEDFRRKELLKCGIDLKNEFLPKKIVLDFEKKEGRVPMYKDGIMYASPYSKGNVLTEMMLKHMTHLDIKKIYFVDDYDKQIKDIFNTCHKLGVECVCIHYDDKEINYEKFDINFGMYQFDYFVKNNKWLDDSYYDEYKKTIRTFVVESIFKTF